MLKPERVMQIPSVIRKSRVSSLVATQDKQDNGTKINCAIVNIKMCTNTDSY